MGFYFHKDFINEENKKQYIQFLSNLLKDRPYVQMTYMTGILPIAKYSDGSELNMLMSMIWHVKKNTVNILAFWMKKLTSFMTFIKDNKESEDFKK